MEQLISKIDRVYIDECSQESELASRCLQVFPKNKIEIVKGRPFPESAGELSAEEFDRSKKNLFVTEYKGHFFKRCPGNSSGLACCNYFVLNLGLQCDMNCSYCYLQDFINTPIMTVYSNIDRALAELSKMAEAHEEKSYRVGTGETVDSLSLDELTLYSRKLIEFFRRFPNWRLEFKTKSDKVDQFLDCQHADNVIVSWSINPQEIIENEEHGTASLEARFAAAERCRDKGFILAFHMDPVIWHPGWEKNYLNLVEEINRRFDPGQIPYISLGALRFQPEQRHIMRERFGFASWVNQAEMFPSRDGKLRYDSNLRNLMFQKILEEFKKLDSRWNVFLCMETHESWLASYGQSPKKVSGLTELFSPLPHSL